MLTQEWLEHADLLTTDLHMHTVYCDGRNTPEEMVVSAIDKGMSCIGFSGHSYAPFDHEFGMNPEKLAAYKQEIRDLQGRYGDRIRILCGIEMDYHSDPGVYQEQNRVPGNDSGDSAASFSVKDLQSGFDYVIGSVHYIDTPEGPAGVDNTPEIFASAVERFFNNDYYLAAEAYFELVSDVVRRTGCDIIGHFDLITKFNEKYQFFNESHPRYIAAWQKAADLLIPEKRIFEINTGAMSRGWKSTPYPSQPMINYIRDRGGRFILSSDSHRSDTIGFCFAQAAANL